VISAFTGEYRFLSNFFIEPDWSHVEGEYQVLKCANPDDVAQFSNLTPAQCKALGRRVDIRKDWEPIKLAVMYDLVLAKFREHPTLMAMLLNTKDQKLVEGNRWGDRYWGVCGSQGENHLGKILMKVRDEVRVVARGINHESLRKVRP